MVSQYADLGPGSLEIVALASEELMTVGYCECKYRRVIVEFSTLLSRAWAMANPSRRNCARRTGAGTYCNSCAARIMAWALNPHFRGRRKKLPPGQGTLPRRSGPTAGNTFGQDRLFR